MHFILSLLWFYPYYHIMCRFIGQVSNSHPILKLKLHSAKNQDKNKIKCKNTEEKGY